MADNSFLNGPAEGLKQAFTRLGEFFHVFDLSFIVAGTVSFGAVAFLLLRLGVDWTMPFPGWVQSFAIVLACYVLGLLSFAAGRYLNLGLFRQGVLEKEMRKLVATYKPEELGDDTDMFVEGGQEGLQSLYGRLWQELLANFPKSEASYHLSRYWAMAATCDGLAISLFLWCISVVVSACLGIPIHSFLFSMIISVVLFLAAVLSLIQGARFFRYQIGDLVAAIVVLKRGAHKGTATGSSSVSC